MTLQDDIEMRMIEERFILCGMFVVTPSFPRSLSRVSVAVRRVDNSMSQTVCDLPDIKRFLDENRKFGKWTITFTKTSCFTLRYNFDSIFAVFCCH